MRTFLSVLIFLLFSNNTLQAESDTQIKQEATEIVKKWNNSFNNKDIPALRTLFGPTVYYYGTNLNNNEVIKDIERQLLTSYNQLIKSDIEVSFYTTGIIKCEFIKEVFVKGKRKSYPSYLLLLKTGSEYSITGESDEISDKNTNGNNNIGLESGMYIERESKFSWFLVVTFLLTILGFYLVFREFKKKSNKSNDNYLAEAKITSNQTFKNRPTFFPSESEKGHDFEKFVVDRFKKEYFILKHWRSDKMHNGISPDSNKYPDLEYDFKTKSAKAKIAIECKWRSGFDDGKIEWAKDYQIKNYIHYKKENGVDVVFVLIGIGGMPNYPDELYIIPLEEITSTILYKKSITKYQRFSKSSFFFNPDYRTLT
jgi:hypothetical protein